ncbi:MAG: hypothetical protein KAI24_16020 [Planctomycetes bacterium]|nr:hypothetical protein [Planctomycetota bacterium]
MPARRTVMARDRDRVLFAKRYRTRRGADAEWRWLGALRAAGFAAAAPVGKVAGEAGSMVVFAAVPGRSLDAWAVDAADAGWLDRWFDYCVTAVAPLVRRLHARRWVHRDLNLAHLFAVDPMDRTEPALIDVERMFRPRWRWRRWAVKELASLWASSPVPVPLRVRVRFLRRYDGDASARSRRLFGAAIARKLARIQGHAPRFG